MPLQNSTNSTAFSVVLADILARLRTAPGGRVKSCAAPNDQLHEYTAAEGLLVRVRGPEPEVLAGAGRYGQLAYRDVDVVVLTENLKDPPGKDDIAVTAHLNKEEAVANTMNIRRVGIQVKWIPGGAEIARQVKRDSGMLLSVLSFRVFYTVPMTVNLG